MNNSYASFAQFYDILQKKTGTAVDYRRLGEYYHELIGKHKVKKTQGKSVLLDLGCGTGLLSGEFARLGYEVIGVDGSPEMLSIAEHNLSQGKLKKYGKNVRLICQQMSELNLHGQVDVCVSSLDCINHLTSEKQVQAVFKKVSSHLGRGGLFMFDVNTIYKHREVLSDNTYTYDLEELFCVWQNYVNEDNVVEIVLDFFCPDGKGKYVRHTDSFCEKAYSLATLCNLLGSARFEVAALLDWGKYIRGDERCEKVVFVARKI